MIGLALFFWTASATAYDLTVSTADTDPYSNEDSTGYYDLLVREAFGRVGVEIRIVHQPSDRSFQDVVTGAVDAEYARIESIGGAYDSLVMVREPLAMFSFSAFVRDPSLVITSWSDLGSLDVAYINGWRILEENVDSYSSLTVVPDEESLFRILDAGRVDVAIYSLRRGQRYLQTHEMPAVVAAEPPLARRPMYLYLNAEHADLAGPLAQALRSMRDDGTVARIERTAFGSAAGR